MKLSFKSFAVELLINLLIFFILCLLFFFIFFNNRWASIIPDLFSIDSLLMIPWLFFTVLLFRLVFLKIFPVAHYKTAIRNLFIISIAIYIVDITFLNILIFLRGQFDGVFFYTSSFWMRFAMFFSYAVAYSFIRGFAYLREQKLQLQNEHIDSQLKQLHAQIEPHFIFNTLNSIYALSLEEKAERTSLCIEELSELFRYSFRENGPAKVNIKEELNFIENYIHLNQVRFSNNDSLKINAHIEWDKKPAQIAPILLVNFIENAFKFGVNQNNDSEIDITITVENKLLDMIITNTICTDKEIIQNGVGLANTIKRLNLLYSGNYSFKEVKQQNSYLVELQMNLV
jgi:sensor histidine kinase YesM